MAVWLKESIKEVETKIFLFMLSPFIAFLYALNRIQTKSSYVVFFLFAIFFGLAFTVSNVRTENSADGISYRSEFEQYQYVSEYTYYDGLEGFLTFDDGKKDYYFDTIAFYLSRITDNYHFLFMFFAVVFAFFQLKAFSFFTSERNFNNSLFCILLAFLFTYNQIFNINGMRFWTAAWVGVYCICQIFRNGDKKYFLLAICTPFFHGAFWVYVGMVLIAYSFRKFEKIWIFFFVISFFISSFAVELVQNANNYLPSFLAKLVDSYTRVELIQARQQAGTGYWIIGKIFDILVRIYINLLVFLFIRDRKRIEQEHRSMYLFLLVWMVFVNFAMPIPSLGSRFVLLAYPVLAYLWLVHFGCVRYRYWIYVLPFVFFMDIYQWVKLYLGVLNMSFFYSSPFVLIYKYF